MNKKELLEKLQESFGVESTPSEIKFEGMFDKVKNGFHKLKIYTRRTNEI